MPIKKKRCKFCHTWFRPDPRTEHQISCTDPLCRKQCRAAANKTWRQRNPGYDKSRAGKRRVWARERTYYPNYRRTHPDYAARDNKRRSKAHRAGKCAANQDARHEIAVERLASTRANIPNPSANQDAIARRVDIIAEYLSLCAPSANPNGTDLNRSGGA